MKISLAITTLIIALAAFFGTQQHREITILTTEWELLETSAGQMGISTDPDLKTSATSVRTIHQRAAHAESIKAFAAELAAYEKKMEAVKKAVKSTRMKVRRNSSRCSTACLNRVPPISKFS